MGLALSLQSSCVVRLSLALAAAWPFGCSAPSGSSLNDLATTSSYKSGFFAPRLKEEFSARLAGSAAPLTPSAFLAEVRRLTAKGGLTLWKPAGLEYAVAVASGGEQILLAFTKAEVPDPVLSIRAGRVYSWGPYVKKVDDKAIVSDLFLRRPYGKTSRSEETKIDVADLYVRRMALNSDGFKEPVLVPWLAHVRSETSAVVVYRIGNTIMDARSQRPALEFRRLGAGSAWAVIGPYADDDVAAGTVFFKAKGDTYYSVRPDSSTAVRWQKQDGDSLDRVTTLALQEVRLPREVADYLATLPDVGHKSHPVNQTVTGFDWLEGDSGVVQLERNDLTFGRLDRKSGRGLGLTAAAFQLEWYQPTSWWGADNEPVEKTGTAGAGLDGVVFTDQSGARQGGVVLAERNDPNGENRIYTVLNRTKDTVTEVNADGSTLGSPIPRDEYELRAKGTLQRMETMRESGELQAADGRAIAAAQGLDARAARQIERSESLVAGSTVSGMAGDLFKDAAVSAVTTEAKAQASRVTGSSGVDLAIDKALIGQASDTLAEGAPTTTEGFVTQGEKLIFDTGAAWTVEQSRVTAGQKTADVVAATADVTWDGIERYKEGDFSTSNPDYEFDSSVSLAGIAGTAVAEGAGVYAKSYIPADTVGRASAGDAVTSVVAAPLKTTEAFSRASYAETLTGQAGEELDQRLEMRQREEAYGTGLGALEALDAQEAQVD